MDISWYGLSCFRLRESGTTIVCDPFDKSVGGKVPKLSADVVTVSHDKPGHSNVDAVDGNPKVFSGPGEYETNNIFITGMATYHHRKDGEVPERNVAYFIDFGDMIVGHLGDIGEVPKQSAIEELQLGEVDILLVPVGGGAVLDPTRAVDIVGLFEPKIVIPMHYRQEKPAPKWMQELEPVEKFLKELGVSSPMPEAQKSLRLSKSSLPEETQVMLLSAE